VSVLFEKAYGCLAGLALGDALGMATEFLTPQQIEEHYGWVEGLVSAPSWHPHAVLPEGHVTDDTGQALALAGVYVRDGVMSAQSAAQALLRWADEQGDHLELYLGPSTRRALAALRAGVDPRESGGEGTTNGAAMRAAPIGIVHTGDFDGALRDAIEAALPTHGTRAGISAAAAVALAVAEAMRADATVESVLDRAMAGAIRGREHGAWVWTAPIERRIALARRSVREAEDEREALRILYDYVGVDMTVSESVPTAFGLIELAGGDPMRAVMYAANIGGDTDTIGAIAGAVCGAMQGIGAIDCGLLRQVEEMNQLGLEQVAANLVAVADVMRCAGSKRRGRQCKVHNWDSISIRNGLR
jgi:ADP-ribosylglycohydrolase